MYLRKQCNVNLCLGGGCKLGKDCLSSWCLSNVNRKRAKSTSLEIIDLLSKNKKMNRLLFPTIPKEAQDQKSKTGFFI